MDDYRWFDFQHLPFVERFPPRMGWIVGAGEWAAGMRQFPPRDAAAANQFLDSIRLAGRPRPRPQCPRVFVSHRQIDEMAARRLAWLAWDEGFDYWLDVIDLDPQRNQQVIAQEQILGRTLTAFEKSVLIAAIIEMALLNCTHVLAAMTDNTAGSQWVPYEYGRVKEALPVAVQAACWRAPTLPRSHLAEYLHLGAVLDSESEIRMWMRGERAAYAGCPGGHRGSWGGSQPDPLPT